MSCADDVREFAFGLVRDQARLMQASAPRRPPRTYPVAIGDAELIAGYALHGEHLRATMTDPEEWPEIELLQLSTQGGEDVSGLLEFPPVHERILDVVTKHEHDLLEATS